MPYDPAVTRSLLSIAGAYANHPTGDYIASLAKQLAEAEAEIAGAVAGRKKAELDSNRYAADLQSAQATIRKLSELIPPPVKAVAREQPPAPPPPVSNSDGVPPAPPRVKRARKTA